jgi:trypsin-like peptidase
MHWDSIIQKVGPHIVKIDTPTGSGTGFFCGYNQTRAFCYIATAAHVIADTDDWQQPLRLSSHTFQKTSFLKESDRVIFKNERTDSAIILFSPKALNFPTQNIPLRPIATPINIGVEVGWLGYPSIEPQTLCFFSGSVSARREDRSAYLIDGVAINGVSGGPVIFSDETDGAQFVGIVSAYRANRLRGDALPGLLIAQDLSHFHNIIQTIRSLDEAKEKKPEVETPKNFDSAQQTPVS